MAKDVQKGDKIVVAFNEQTVKRVHSETTYFTEEGRVFTEGPGVDITVTKKAVPDNWPPQFNDVWLGEYGNIYHLDVNSMFRTMSFSTQNSPKDVLSDNHGKMTLLWRK